MSTVIITRSKHTQIDIRST